jgi:hypothetical protein
LAGRTVARDARDRETLYGTGETAVRWKAELRGRLRNMKRLLVLAAAAAALTVSACDDPRASEDFETVDTPIEAPVAPAVEDVAEPDAAVAPAATPPPVDQSTLPADKRTSEESVRPESDTLFY